jgi:hypothetical protein
VVDHNKCLSNVPGSRRFKRLMFSERTNGVGCAILPDNPDRLISLTDSTNENDSYTFDDVGIHDLTWHMQESY